MTDISDRVIDESKKSVSMDNGEYKLHKRHFIPLVGLKRYTEVDCPSSIQDQTFLERGTSSEKGELEGRRENRTLGLVLYNVSLVVLPALSIFYFASQP